MTVYVAKDEDEEVYKSGFITNVLELCKVQLVTKSQMYEAPVA